MVIASELYGRELVRLTDVSQELTVGVGGATASVRTLNDVSLVIRSRELVVLSGSRGAGERAVLAVIAGDRRGVTGTCAVHANTRVRLLRISVQAAFALTEEWQRSETLYQSDNTFMRTPAAADVARAVSPDHNTSDHEASGHDASDHDASDHEASGHDASDHKAYDHNTPDRKSPAHSAPDHDPSGYNLPGHNPLDLFLLDVIGDSSLSVPRGRPTLHRTTRRPMYGSVREADAHAPRPWNEKNRSALLAWVSVCRQRGGAVVMAAGESLGHGLFDSALTHVRSTLAAPRASSVRELRFAPSTVRVVAMHCGRLAASVPLHSRGGTT